MHWLKTKSVLLASFMTCNFLTVVAQETNWQLKKDKDGIQVYTRDSEESDLDEFKGVGVIKASVASLVSTLENADLMYEWATCEESKLISRNGNKQIHYTVTDVPFPLQDRDSYAQFEYEEVSNGVKVSITALPEYKPTNEGKTRIPFLKGYWLLERISDQATKVTYQLVADPGGSIPTWLANAGSVDTPFDTIKSLRDYLEK